ncbi:MAG: histidinol-phosphatase [Acidimicrobiia bacterium]|nr:histidinol-phosphatase [Acidimicrobiia bacterium]MDH3462507.1 histidinol-phosphatase [Acidimicrobiia bacterium]
MIDFAREMALAAGQLIRERFVARAFETELKDDRSVVTATDREAEEIMRRMISTHYPSHGVIGEEFGSHRTDAEYVWTLDPIDGTISFVAGIPLFGTLIGLLERGKPVLGVINQPISGEMVIGTADGTTMNGAVARCRAVEGLSKATLLTTDPNLIDRHADIERFEELRGRVAMTRTWGDCYGYLMVASGRADIMCDPIMNKWDSIPLIPIIRGAGGVITDWKGDDPVDGTSIVSAAPNLHAEVISILN